MLREFRRIIVSRTDRIGDVVLSLPVFASLKQCFPAAELTALVREYTMDVASSFHAVDRVLTYEASESILSTVRKIKATDPDAILLLFPRFRIALAAFLARVPVRVGTGYRWYSFLFNRKVYEHRKDSVKSEAEYNLSLAEAIGCSAGISETRLTVDAGALRKVKEFLAENSIDRFVAVHPGSGGSAADWSRSNFRELSAAIVKGLDVSIVVTGSAQEKELCAAISEGNPKCVNAAGLFSIREFIALLSMADSFVSNSTGPIHLAASVGTAVVGIYPNNKPMTPLRWAPITKRKSILTPPDGSDDLTKVSVQEVVRSVRDFALLKAE
jgi:lipopolysaccharide heptosyltransferase III